MSISRAFNMQAISARIIRGGSSKGIYLAREDLPRESARLDEIVLKIFGSPDRRQIDGLGGADKLTSKVAVMGKSTRTDCHIDYLFGQVNTELPRVDWAANCGNLSAGAALYGALEGACDITDGVARVAIHQVNTGRRLVASVPFDNDWPAVDGHFVIGGVPGNGARIDLDFGDFAGSALGGAVLPTGRPVDKFAIPGLGRIDVSVVDMANLLLFVRASDIGMDVNASIFDMQADEGLVKRLEAVRKAVSAEIGFITGLDADERLRISTNPLIFAVAPALDYQATNSMNISASAYHLFSRSLARYEFSKAYPGSGAAGTGVAAGIPGTLVHEAVGDIGQSAGPYDLRVGHPGGILEVAAEVSALADHIEVRKALIGRTARLLMDGKAYIR